MANLNYKLLLILLVLFSGTFCMAQEEVLLGNKKGKRNGSTTNEKGGGMGIAIDTKKDTVRLQRVEPELHGEHSETIKYYLRIFPLKDNERLSNIAPEKLYVQSLESGKIIVDLKEEKLDLNGAYVIGLEWAEEPTSAIKTLGFYTSVFKDGIYVKDSDELDWKKVRFLGFDLQTIALKK